MAEKKKNKGGRPRKYSKKLAGEICELIASGLSLRKALDKLGKPISENRIREILCIDKEFSTNYALACRRRAEVYAEQILDIADESSDGTGPEQAKARLRVDARKWVVSKMLPKQYGDRLSVEQSGSVTVKHQVDLSNLSKDDLLKLKEILSKTEIKKDE